MIKGKKINGKTADEMFSTMIPLEICRKVCKEKKMQGVALFKGV